jgi:hypothetical protein
MDIYTKRILMTIRSRLIRLERAAGPRAAPATDAFKPQSDEEAADRTGAFLWLTPDWSGLIQKLAKNPLTADKAAMFRAWDISAKAARAAGHTGYHAGLRPQAMAVWLAMKPDIQDLERTHERWISLKPAPGDEAPTPGEFDNLPLEERIRVLRSQATRPGYWPKIGPESTSRRRRDR